MTAGEVKTILRNAREAGIKYYIAHDRALHCEQRLIGGKSVRYSGEASHEKNGNSVERNLCALIDYQTESEERRAELAKPYSRAMRLIHLAPDPALQEVLKQYYLNCRSWKQVAMGLSCGVRYVLKLHGRALIEISKKT